MYKRSELSLHGRFISQWHENLRLKEKSEVKVGEDKVQMRAILNFVFHNSREFLGKLSSS
jgi:hypothetical protein